MVISMDIKKEFALQKLLINILQVKTLKNRGKIVLAKKSVGNRPDVRGCLMSRTRQNSNKETMINQTQQVAADGREAIGIPERILSVIFWFILTILSPQIGLEEIKE